MPGYTYPMPGARAGVVVAALFALGCRAEPLTGRKALQIVPKAAVDALGDLEWDGVDEEGPSEANPKVVEWADEVARRVVAASPLAGEPVDIRVIHAPTVNAFALPPHHVAIFTGILPIAANEAGLAAILGHEVGHVVARHVDERLSQQLLANGAEIGLDLFLPSSDYKRLILAGAGLGLNFGVLLPYSRTQEQEADAIGLGLMAKAGYDPAEAVEVWRRMQAANLGEIPAFLSDHPSNESRIEDLRKNLAAAEILYAASPTKFGLGALVPGTVPPPQPLVVPKR
jgi:metalloendopeptidase OMA1, mitochondrial